MPAKLLPADKLTHYLIGSLIVLLTLPLGWQWAVCACVGFAIGRETYGAARGGEFDVVDLAATVAGGLVVLVAYFLGAA